MTDPTIKHLVISSGGPAGHMMYSILRTLNIKGVWNMKDIKTIYGSSIVLDKVNLTLEYFLDLLQDKVRKHLK